MLIFCSAIITTIFKEIIYLTFIWSLFSWNVSSPTICHRISFPSVSLLLTTGWPCITYSGYHHMWIRGELYNDDSGVDMGFVGKLVINCFLLILSKGFNLFFFICQFWLGIRLNINGQIQVPVLCLLIFWVPFQSL